MADRTFAEQLQRTRELNDELRSLWPGLSINLSVHNIDHQALHESSVEPTTVFKHEGDWIMSIALDPGTYTGRVFASVDLSCEDCRKLRPTLPEKHGGPTVADAESELVGAAS